jgi:hypothetical protein
LPPGSPTADSNLSATPPSHSSQRRTEWWRCRDGRGCLWREALNSFGLGSEGLEPSYVDGELDKWDLPVALNSMASEEQPLGAIYVLADGSKIAIRRLDGAAAAEALFVSIIPIVAPMSNGSVGLPATGARWQRWLARSRCSAWNGSATLAGLRRWAARCSIMRGRKSLEQTAAIGKQDQDKACRAAYRQAP